MTRSVDLDELRAVMTGAVVGPAAPDYDEARRVRNGDIDRRPAVARCASAADVAAAVTYARERGLEIAVRGGAHSMWGASAIDDGLVIDLRLLNGVSVDVMAKRARVGGGALLGEVDAATQEHGLAVPSGIVSHTGIGGLTLGGGLGWLTRGAGLTIDNLVSAQVVTASGEVRRASQDENPQLFWALRGGGGNFGVVTEFEFQLHEVGPIIQFGLLFWGLDQGADVLRLAQRVIETMPRSLNMFVVGMNAPPEPFVPEQYRLQPGYALLIAGFGSSEEHAELVSRISADLPPLFDFVTPMPYTALQQLMDEANGWGVHCYQKSLYLEAISDDVIEVITEQLPGKTSPLSVLAFYRLDEAFSEPGDMDTAFSGGRSPRWSTYVIAFCPTPEMLVADRAWVRQFFEALRPLGLDDGADANHLNLDDQDRIRAAYGDAKLRRLAEIKGQYDPGNIFHRNINIKPL